MGQLYWNNLSYMDNRFIV